MKKTNKFYINETFDLFLYLENESIALFIN